MADFLRIAAFQFYSKKEYYFTFLQTLFKPHFKIARNAPQMPQI